MKNKINIVFFLLIAFSVSVYAGKQVKIVILHTNDTHSQVVPSESNDMGGYARRMGVIDKIRSEEPYVLLVDAGDFSQGSPFFNFFNGRVEITALKMMGYDAVTFGNHEFDNGIDTLTAVLKQVNVPIVNTNYDLQATSIQQFVKPYLVVKKAGLRIGIFGIGVNLNGVQFQKNYAGVVLNEPIKAAVETSDLLKKELKCDLVICLSHLGVENDNGAPTDYDVIAASKNIDVVIGGHSHSMIENKTALNAEGKPVIIAQMGKSGLYLGRIDLSFEKKKVKK